MREVDELARFAAELAYGDLPTPVVERAIAVVRDMVGVIIAGMREPDVHGLADWATREHPGPVALFGHGGRVDPTWATFVHAAAGNTLEMDEGHAYARGHAAIHAVPTALAMGAAQSTPGRTLLATLVAGYEVAARAGVATTLRPAVHPFGAWGVLGAAAIGGRWHGCRAGQMAGCLQLASAYAINPSFDAALQGANGRNTYAGVVNQLGLLAADLYSLGFRGESAGVHTTFGKVLGDGFQAGALVDGLGSRFEIVRGYFKPYSSCRFTHAAVEAAMQLRAQHGLDPAAIDRVEVETYDFATRLNDPRPQTALAGRFSVPYVVAAVLTTGGAGPEIFTADRLTDPTLLNLAARVTVREDPALTAMTPSRRPARMRVATHDGRVFEALVTNSKGDPDLPMSAEELRAKFNALVAPTLGAGQTDALWNVLGRLPDLESVGELDPLTMPVDGSAR